MEKALGGDANTARWLY